MARGAPGTDRLPLAEHCRRGDVTRPDPFVAPSPPCIAPWESLPEFCPGWCEFLQGDVGSASPSDPIAPGTVIDDRFRVTRRIGRGGMGEVYEATADDGERVALKLVRQKLVDEPAMHRRLRTEGQALLRVRHPNVVGGRGVGVHQGMPYVAMEHIDGGSLDDATLSGRRRLSAPRAAEVMIAVCDGVQALHEAGIVHNDLKTGNVFRARDGRIVVADLGTARPLASCCRIPDGVIEGTPGYLAPELADGRGGVPSAASDIFALGIMMVRLLTGRLPFEQGESSDDHRAWPRAWPPWTVAPALPPGLDALVCHTTRREAKDRPPSARAVRERLHAIARGLQPRRARRREVRA